MLNCTAPGLWFVENLARCVGHALVLPVIGAVILAVFSFTVHDWQKKMNDAERILQNYRTQWCGRFGEAIMKQSGTGTVAVYDDQWEDFPTDSSPWGHYLPKELYVHHGMSMVANQDGLNMLHMAVDTRLPGRYRAEHQYGVSRFWRVPDLPTWIVRYEHQTDLAWWQLPVGPSENGGVAVVNLKNCSSALVTGKNGSGKTSLFMAWIAHLLQFDNAELHLCDIKRTDFLWARKFYPHVASVSYDIKSIQVAVHKAVEEMRRRQSLVDAEDMKPITEQRELVFDPYILFIDEVAEVSRQARRDNKMKGLPEVVEDQTSLACLARSLNVRLIRGTQQPNVNATGPSESRDQAYDVLCSNPSTEHRRMLSLPATMTFPDLSFPGRCVLIHPDGESLEEAQTFWIASPSAPTTPSEEKIEAYRWLPEIPRLRAIESGLKSGPS